MKKSHLKFLIPNYKILLKLLFVLFLHSAGSSFGQVNYESGLFDNFAIEPVIVNFREAPKITAGVGNFELAEAEPPEIIQEPFAFAGNNFIKDDLSGYYPNLRSYTDISLNIEFRPGAPVRPADACISASDRYLILATNLGLVIYEKAGMNKVYENRYLNLVATAGINSSSTICDPFLYYDEVYNQWILTLMTITVEKRNGATYYSNSNMLIMTSKNSDPTEDWYIYRISGYRNGNEIDESVLLLDYPQFSLTRSSENPLEGYMIISSYQFVNTGPEYSKLQIIDKNILFTGKPIEKYRMLWKIKDPGNQDAFPKPVINYSPTVNGNCYLISTDGNTSDRIMLWSLEFENRNMAPELKGTELAVTGYSDPDQFPIGVCPTGVRKFYSRVMSAYSVDDKVYCVYNSNHNYGANFKSDIRFLEIDVSGRRIVSDFVIGNDQYHFGWPVISPVLGSNGTAMAFISGKQDLLPQANFVILNKEDIQKRKISSAVVQEATGNFYGCEPRLGDYSGMCVDPVDKSIWAAVMFYTAGRWGISIINSK